MAKEKKSERKLRILWSSNAPWASSGYSNQTADLLPRFKKEGWHTAISCFYGLEGGLLDWKGIKCYPKMNEQWGTDAAAFHGKDFNADITIPFQDSWVMDINNIKQMNRYTPYVPIDHDPVPGAVLDRIRWSYRTITYSKFGRDQLSSRGFNSVYIPHGVDTKIFKPMDKMEAKKTFGLPTDLYMFGMVAANKDNPPRKQFQQAMDAFFQFQKIHPKSAMFFHTIMQHPNGFPIMEYANHLGIPEKIYFLKPYEIAFKLDKPMMAKLINAFDCLLNVSSNEGFGMTITEAQSCGVPPIVTDFTSMPELIKHKKTGYKTKVAFKRFAPLLGYVAQPDVEDLVANMHLAFTADREKMAKDARDHMIKDYDIDMLVKKYWNPLFEEIEKDIYKE